MLQVPYQVPSADSQATVYVLWGDILRQVRRVQNDYCPTQRSLFEAGEHMRLLYVSLKVSPHSSHSSQECLGLTLPPRYHRNLTSFLIQLWGSELHAPICQRTKNPRM